MPSAVARRLEAITTRGGIRFREIAQLLNTRPETISRWNQGKAAPHTRRLKRLLRLEWLIEQLADFYEPDEARVWLFSPHRLLGGDTPADRIEHGKINDVLALVEQLRDGTFA